MKLGGWLIMLTAMIMLLTFMGFNIGLTTIIEKVGININQDTSELESSDMESSSFWDYIFNSTTGIFVALLGATVVIGFFAKGYDTSLVLLPLVIFLAGAYISVFWGIISHIQGYHQWWLTSLIGLIFSVLAIGYVMACVDYFGGR